jgi:S1-C subfamily serine protease
VVTTEATVKRDADLTITLPDGRRVPAKLVGRDPGTDLAALSIEAGLLPVADRADSTRLKPGHLVLALARLGESGIRVSFGAVSAVGDRWRCWKGGEIDQWLQSDLSLYPGFGGGPLADSTGAVLGINSGGLSRPLATTVPGSTVDRVLDHLTTRGFVARGWLGVAMQPVRLDSALRSRLGVEQQGALVVLSIEPDGPAASGGLLIGDVILGLDGRVVEHPEAVLEFLGRDSVGRTIQLDLVRGGARTRLDLVVGERPRRPR